MTFGTIEEPDLDLLRRLDTDPAASQPFEWAGFRDPRACRRRWEQTAGSAATPPTSPWPYRMGPWSGL